jgi:hypothetical protein
MDNMSEPMDAGTKFLIGATVSGVALGALVLYNYPQKYWIPWLIIIEGCVGTTMTVGFFVLKE